MLGVVHLAGRVPLDLRMPVPDGLSVPREVAHDPALAAARLVMLTTSELDGYVFEALRHGASGVLLKDSEPAELLQAVRVVADGGSLLSPTVTRRVIAQFAGQGAVAAVPHPDLGRLAARDRADRRLRDPVRPDRPGPVVPSSG